MAAEGSSGDTPLRVRAGGHPVRCRRVIPFNPYAQRRLDPHDNALIALGMRLFAFAAEAAAVVRDISGGAPNVPQLWAAGTPFILLRAIMQLRQDARSGNLYVDPALPDGCRTWR
jgi:hypothetical protein